MVVLRCPYCGEKIDKNMKFCSHCGSPIDKPIVDNYATNYQESGRLIVKCIVFFVLWFIVLMLLGFVTYSVLGISDNHLLCFVLSIVLTSIFYYGLKKVF